MNFEGYKAPRVQEINYVDFYVVKDFGKKGLMTLKVPYSLIDMIGEDTPIEGMEVECSLHTFDYPYRDLLDKGYSQQDFVVVVYEAKDLRYRHKGKLTYQREEFGDNVRIVITPIFNEDKYNNAVIEVKEEQKRLTEKFISDAIVVCAGAESDMLLEGKAYKLMDKAVAAHGISQKALDYFDEFKFLID